jgi:hypothetical protein
MTQSFVGRMQDMQLALARATEQFVGFNRLSIRPRNAAGPRTAHYEMVGLHPSTIRIRRSPQRTKA